ncbi:hypothetical protein [Halorubrum sp. CBA1229]|uniref:hypothetical protein n=1 Tax=Halorubrum sp. CBA1229 TaxID=1853699 RepID=UPI00159422D5|nr:hypothetical protein [Halorubrum sp. CBA1229]QKY15454.1 hypothetical protein Hrr1229_000600 [Halorubrum sp. CBA1229]
MEPATREAKYHVVCRDCSVERLFESDAEATALEREHAEETDHRIVVGRVW